MNWLPLCVVLFAMYVGTQMTHIPHLPRCPFCGKNRDHVKARLRRLQPDERVSEPVTPTTPFGI